MSHPRQSWNARPHGPRATLRHWLCDPGSLTQRLKARCGTFRVVPLKAGLARPNLDEYAVLNVRHGRLVYVREVLLLCDGVPVVFAHSVVARDSLRGGWCKITRLGTRPLGESLFSDHRIARQPLRFKPLRARHALHTAARRQIETRARCIWARRSVFCLHRHPLLVTEVFLPSIEAL